MRPFDPAQLPEVADVVVIGGGITGAATARDAALRGLSVVLVERDDFAAGTSSKSTKLVHGGLRYLRTYQFRMVHESVRERELMHRLAPHLTHLRPFIYLVRDGDPEGRALLNLGLTFYDLFSMSPLWRRHRMLSARDVLEREPHLDPRGLRGGGRYYDFLTDDARLVIDTLKGAVAAGALVANHREVTGLPVEHGRVRGVQVVDGLTGRHTEIRARIVLNTSGPWVDGVRRMEDPEAPRSLRPTKGAHIVVRKSDFPLEHAVFLHAPRDNRVVWPIPALDDEYVYIGTTDTDYDGPLDHVIADADDVSYLLEAANAALPDARLDGSHVVTSWAGLRPLVAPPPGMPADAAPREHKISRGPGGMFTIAGGKLTTSRVMARQLVDAAVRALGAEHGLRGVPPCTTHRVALPGGDAAGLFRARHAIAGRALPPVARRRLLERYGGAADRVAAHAEPGDGAGLGTRGLTLAEIRHAVREEMARSLGDVLIRRTATFFWSDDGGLDDIATIADTMGGLLGWTPAERTRQIAAYTREVRANRP